jgi:hypothetical protein
LDNPQDRLHVRTRRWFWARATPKLTALVADGALTLAQCEQVTASLVAVVPPLTDAKHAEHVRQYVSVMQAFGMRTRAQALDALRAQGYEDPEAWLRWTPPVEQTLYLQRPISPLVGALLSRRDD